MSVEQLDVLIRNVQADSERMRLLEILSQQLEQLVHKGRPDLHAFCAALKEKKLCVRRAVQATRRELCLG
jgi:hypothetical protein